MIGDNNDIHQKTKKIYIDQHKQYLKDVDLFQRFYDYSVNDHIKITPAVFVIEKDRKDDVNGALLKTTFTF